MASTSATMRPLKRSTMPLVCGVRGLIWRYSAPSSAHTLAKAWVKQLPLSVNTCHAAGQGSGGFAQESDGTGFGFIVLDGKMDRAGTAVDGDVEIALAPLAIGSLQLGQVLDVNVHEAEV